jgi:3-hydroxyisobutyrate dehydrogenase-like beta-hydroxyacid dehydrogenase
LSNLLARLSLVSANERVQDKRVQELIRSASRFSSGASFCAAAQHHATSERSRPCIRTCIQARKEKSPMELGFIGLGRMGSAIARNLVKAGHHVTVYNRTREKAEKLAEAGANIAEDPAEAAKSELLITMLTDDEALITVMFGECGAFPALKSGAIHIGMSTISPKLSDRLATEHARAGHSYVAAPVMGRPEAAEAAELFIIAAGPASAIDCCGPVFDAVGQKTFVIGPEASQANLVKLSVNFLTASTLESLGESFALIRKSGIDPARYLDVLTGSLFNAPVYKTYGKFIAQQTYEPAAFKLSYGLKDIRLALDAAAARCVPMPAASLVEAHMIEGLAQGQANADWGAIARVCATNAGLPN